MSLILIIAFLKHFAVLFDIGVSTHGNLHKIWLNKHEIRRHEDLHEFTGDPIMTVGKLLEVRELLDIVLYLGIILSY